MPFPLLDNHPSQCNCPPSAAGRRNSWACFDETVTHTAATAGFQLLLLDQHRKLELILVRL
jgi:hypothetical protein